MRSLVVLAFALGACRAPTSATVQSTPTAGSGAAAAASENGGTTAVDSAVAADSPDATAQNEGSATRGATSPQTAVAPTLTELRATHPVRNEGADCQVDDDCDPPLRCDDAMCAFPGAMTGAVDGSTPQAVFYTPGGDRSYYLELAATASQRTRGLMFRRVMVNDWGMLFLFDAERQQTFWMRNTLIPLDMVFIRADMTVDSIQASATPQTDTPRPSTGPAQFVLELNGGEAARVGIVPGTRVEFLNLPTSGD